MRGRGASTRERTLVITTPSRRGRITCRTPLEEEEGPYVWRRRQGRYDGLVNEGGEEKGENDEIKKRRESGR